MREGRTIFSKAEAGRFPAEGEVEERFAAAKAGQELPSIEKRGGVLSRIATKLRG